MPTSTYLMCWAQFAIAAAFTWGFVTTGDPFHAGMAVFCFGSGILMSQAAK